MCENIFKELLGEMMKCELAEFDYAPKWKPSLRHRFAMKQIFSRYEKNVHKMQVNELANAVLPLSRLNIKHRIFLALVIVLLMTLLVGWVNVFVSRNFHGTVYEDNTKITAVNLENSPKTIKYKYALSGVPNGFELIETNTSQTNVYTLYMNRLTKQTITLYQWVKSHYTPHVNTEHYSLEEVSINKTTGLYVDLSNKDYCRTLLIWDNGDYIIEVLADLDKDSAINLLETNKLLNFPNSYVY